MSVTKSRLERLARATAEVAQRLGVAGRPPAVVIWLPIKEGEALPPGEQIGPLRFYVPKAATSHDEAPAPSEG
jgi:hypothetical protein